MYRQRQCIERIAVVWIDRQGRAIRALGLGQSPQAMQFGAEIVLGVEIVRPQFDGPAEVGERRVALTQRTTGQAAIVERLGKIRPPGESLGQNVDRVAVAP